MGKDLEVTIANEIKELAEITQEEINSLLKEPLSNSWLNHDSMSTAEISQHIKAFSRLSLECAFSENKEVPEVMLTEFSVSPESPLRTLLSKCTDKSNRSFLREDTLAYFAAKGLVYYLESSSIPKVEKRAMLLLVGSSPKMWGVIRCMGELIEAYPQLEGYLTDILRVLLILHHDGKNCRKSESPERLLLLPNRIKDIHPSIARVSIDWSWQPGAGIANILSKDIDSDKNQEVEAIWQEVQDAFDRNDRSPALEEFLHVICKVNDGLREKICSQTTEILLPSHRSFNGGSYLSALKAGTNSRWALSAMTNDALDVDVHVYGSCAEDMLVVLNCCYYKESCQSVTLDFKLLSQCWGTHIDHSFRGLRSIHTLLLKEMPNATELLLNLPSDAPLSSFIDELALSKTGNPLLITINGGTLLRKEFFFEVLEKRVTLKNPIIKTSRRRGECWAEIGRSLIDVANKHATAKQSSSHMQMEDKLNVITEVILLFSTVVVFTSCAGSIPTIIPFYGTLMTFPGPFMAFSTFCNRILTQSKVCRFPDTRTIPSNTTSQKEMIARDQTDNTSASEYSPRDIMFCGKTISQDFTHEEGGALQSEGSDVVLIVPPRAVPPGKVFTVHATIHTKLNDYNRWMQSEEEQVLGPVAEYSLDGGEVFDHPAEIRIPLFFQPEKKTSIRVLFGVGNDFKEISEEDEMSYCLGEYCVRIFTKHFTKFIVAGKQPQEITDALLTISASTKLTHDKRITELRLMVHSSCAGLNDFSVNRQQLYDHDMKEIKRKIVHLPNRENALHFPRIHVQLKVDEGCEWVIRTDPHHQDTLLNRLVFYIKRCIGLSNDKTQTCEIDGRDVFLRSEKPLSHMSKPLTDFILENTRTSHQEDVSCLVSVIFDYGGNIGQLVERMPVVYPAKSGLQTPERRDALGRPPWHPDSEGGRTLVRSSPLMVKLLSDNRALLIEVLRVQDLWAYLLKYEVVNQSTVNRLKGNTTSCDRVGALLDYILQGPMWRYHAFLKACVESDQKHIVAELGENHLRYAG